MVVEHATFVINAGQEKDFQAAFQSAKSALSSSKGCKSVLLMRCVEQPNTYRLCIEWETIEYHMVDFKNSPNAATFGAAIRSFIVERQPMFHFAPVG